MRGLKAWAVLPPSENHLQGDFKNIPVMLQDKSLISGNYVPPILPPFFFFRKSPSPHAHYFYPLVQQEEQPWEREPGKAGRRWGYYLGADSDHGHWCFTALPFMWSGSLVGSNYQPNDPNWALWWSGWTGWMTGCTVPLCLCAWIVLYISDYRTQCRVAQCNVCFIYSIDS